MTAYLSAYAIASANISTPTAITTAATTTTITTTNFPTTSTATNNTGTKEQLVVAKYTLQLVAQKAFVNEEKIGVNDESRGNGIAVNNCCVYVGGYSHNTDGTDNTEKNQRGLLHKFVF